MVRFISRATAAAAATFVRDFHTAVDAATAATAAAAATFVRDFDTAVDAATAARAATFCP